MFHCDLDPTIDEETFNSEDCELAWYLIGFNAMKKISSTLPAAQCHDATRRQRNGASKHLAQPSDVCTATEPQGG